MTNYIIDPAVFYWINVLSIIQTVCAVIGGFALTAFIALFITFLCKRYWLSEPEKPDKDSRYDVERYQREMRIYENDLKDLRMTKKYMVIALVAGGLMILVSIFIPSKQTSVEMLIARTATFDNVNWTAQQVKEIIDYIVSALKGAV